MIVITVGMQLPFDRLIRMIDEIAPTITAPVFAQVGAGRYRPKNFDWAKTLAPDAFDTMLKACSVIISHAGIGTIQKAYEYGKPIVLVPRRFALGEHRNDHQLGTVSRLRGRQGIHVAETQVQLKKLLDGPDLKPVEISAEAEIRQEMLGKYVRQTILTMLDRPVTSEAIADRKVHPLTWP